MNTPKVDTRNGNMMMTKIVIVLVVMIGIFFWVESSNKAASDKAKVDAEKKAAWQIEYDRYEKERQLAKKQKIIDESFEKRRRAALTPAQQMLEDEREDERGLRTLMRLSESEIGRRVMRGEAAAAGHGSAATERAIRYLRNMKK